MRTITFYTHYAEGKTLMCKNYADTLMLMEDRVNHIHTTQLSFLSFDLLEKFDKIYLNVNDVVYHLKLGQNTWTDKELRVAHNLLKLVTTHILNKI